MLEFGGEKMSKSLGNDVSLRNVIDTWGREVVLLFFMTGHWRKPIDFTDETLQQAKAQVETFRNFFLDPPGNGGPILEHELAEVLDDDFNTPDALAVMHEWRDHDLLRQGLEIFGIGSLAEQEEAPAELDDLAQRRADARSGGDYSEADRLRQEIEAQGWEVRDVAGDSGYRLVPKR
jgi:cysteinyl-tRNA synthetase